MMVQMVLIHVASYGLLLAVLIGAGLVDAWLVMDLFGLSQFSACVLHGALLTLYMYENWILFTDLEQMKQQVGSITCVESSLRKLVVQRDGLEAHVERLKHARRVTFEDWYRSWHSEKSLIGDARKGLLRKGNSFYGFDSVNMQNHVGIL